MSWSDTQSTVNTVLTRITPDLQQQQITTTTIDQLNHTHLIHYIQQRGSNINHTVLYLCY